MKPSVPILSVIRPSTAGRFRAKLRRVGDCLVFMGCRNLEGYGVVDVSYEYGARRYAILAHRLAWALEHGVDPPEGRIVCHVRECGNPPCCEAGHLYLGDAKSNHEDSVAVGTAFDLGAVMRGRRGAMHPRSVYSEGERRRALWLHWIGGVGLAAVERRLGLGAGTLARWRNEFERAVSAGAAEPIGLEEFAGAATASHWRGRG